MFGAPGRMKTERSRLMKSFLGTRIQESGGLRSIEHFEVKIKSNRNHSVSLLGLKGSGRDVVIEWNTWG